MLITTSLIHNFQNVIFWWRHGVKIVHMKVVLLTARPLDKNNGEEMAHILTFIKAGIPDPIVHSI